MTMNENILNRVILNYASILLIVISLGLFSYNHYFQQKLDTTSQLTNQLVTVIDGKCVNKEYEAQIVKILKSSHDATISLIGASNDLAFLFLFAGFFNVYITSKYGNRTKA